MAKLANRYKEWPVAVLYEILKSLPTNKHCSHPFFRSAVGVVEHKHFAFAIDNGLSFCWHLLDRLISCQDYPIVFRTLCDPLDIWRSIGEHSATRSDIEAPLDQSVTDQIPVIPIEEKHEGFKLRVCQCSR